MTQSCPEARITEDMTVIVPEHLPTNTHILDQPPFIWARLMPELIPDDLLVDPNGWYEFCRFSLLTLGIEGITDKKARVYLRSSQRKYQHLNIPKYSDQKVVEYCEALRRWFVDGYPYIVEYVRAHGKNFTYTLSPQSLEGGNEWYPDLRVFCICVIACR